MTMLLARKRLFSIL